MIIKHLILSLFLAIPLFSCVDSRAFFTQQKDVYLTVIDGKSGEEITDISIKENPSSGTLEMLATQAVSNLHPHYEVSGFTRSDKSEFSFDLDNLRKYFDEHGADRQNNAIWAWEQKYYIDVVANFTPIEYTISYLNIEGVEVSSLPTTYNVETVNNILPTPKKDGYTFSGWYSDGQKMTTLPTNNPKNLILTANWDAIRYSIRYQNTYGISHDNPTSFSKEDNVIVLNPIESTRAYTFNGWKLNGSYVTAIRPSEYSEDIVLYADLTFTTFTANYYVDGKLYQSDELEYRTFSDYIMPECPALAHYSNPRWSQNVTELRNYEIQALYDVDSYVIAYNLPFAIYNPNPTSYTYFDASIDLIPFSSVVGEYTFVGFFLNGQSITRIDTSLETDLLIECRFELVNYSVDYYVNGGLYLSDTINKSNLASYTQPQVPAKLDHDGRWDQAVTVLKDYSINAVYTIKQCVISFDTRGGEAISPMYCQAGQSLTGLPTPQKGYKTFLGWYLEPTYMTAFVEGTVVHDHLTLYAKWLEQRGTITFEVDGGAPVDPMEVVLGEPVNILPETTKRDHNLEGWYLEAELLNKITLPFTPTASMTLYAKWTYVDRFPEYKKIDSASKLSQIKQDPTARYVLMTDIDFDGAILSCFGDFSGVLEGNGHTIRNFTLQTQSHNVSLFATNYGSIKNLKLEKVRRVLVTLAASDGWGNVEGHYAGLCLNNRGFIDDCSIVDLVFQNSLPSSTHFNYYGTFMGGYCVNNYGTISNCYISGSFSTASGQERSGASIKKRCGGIASINAGTIENCYSRMDFNTFAADSNITAGGIAGYIGGTSPVIRNCLFAGQMSNYGIYGNAICVFTEGTNNYNYSSAPGAGVITADEIDSKSFYLDDLHWSESKWNLGRLEYTSAFYAFPVAFGN